MIRRISIVLMLAAALPVSAGDVDPAKHNEGFQPEPAEQKRVEMKRAGTRDVRPASSERVDVSTVSASDAKASPEREPVRKPGPARVTTDKKAPAKFEKKYQSPVSQKYQPAISDAERIKKATLQPEQNTTGPARINRFVFRRNDPAPATAPAGGDNTPAAGTPAAQDSSGS